MQAYWGLSISMPAMMLTNVNGTRNNWAFPGEPEPLEVESSFFRIKHGAAFQAWPSGPCINSALP